MFWTNLTAYDINRVKKGLCLSNLSSWAEEKDDIAVQGQSQSV